jgi:hypothetical protein
MGAFFYRQLETKYYVFVTTRYKFPRVILRIPLP